MTHKVDREFWEGKHPVGLFPVWVFDPWYVKVSAAILNLAFASFCGIVAMITVAAVLAPLAAVVYLIVWLCGGELP